jgi:hypothetical protein
VDHFLKEAERSGGSAGYQTLINEALHQHVEGRAPKFEETLRRILREEINAANWGKRRPPDSLEKYATC